MNKGKKRERNTNFSREETEKLVSLIERYKHIIENKKSDAITWQEKDKVWKAVEANFNSTGSGIFRDAKHLKLKYESLKRDTRRKSSVIRAERYKTGVGVNDAPPLTPIEQKVKEMILLSVEGGESIYDSDQLDVPAKVPASEELVICSEGNIDTVNLEVPMTDTNTTVNLEVPMNDTNTADYIMVPEQCIEVSPPKKWAEWKPASLKSKKHPALSKPIVNLEVPMTDTNTTVNLEVPMSDTNTADYIMVPEQCIDVSPPKKWAEWKPASLKSKKHPALSKPKEKRPFDKLAEGKLEIVILQKKLIEEELEEKCLKKQILKDEMEHKKELQKLERDELLLKIEILKSELENIVNKKKL